MKQSEHTQLVVNWQVKLRSQICFCFLHSTGRFTATVEFRLKVSRLDVFHLLDVCEIFSRRMRAFLDVKSHADTDIPL
jgi:hypothetical protein